MVICLERGADLHTAQLMPLPLTVSCFSKIQIGFTFLVPAYPGSPGQRPVKRVCVCVYCIVSRGVQCVCLRPGLRQYQIIGLLFGEVCTCGYEKLTQSHYASVPWPELEHCLLPIFLALGLYHCVYQNC